MGTDPVMTLIETIGIIAFAASGAIIAVQRKMDLLGVIILAVTTALGGEFIRDLMLGITPPAMFVHSENALTAALTALFVFVIACICGPLPSESLSRIDYFINFFDSLGLGAFVVSGINTAIVSGYTDNAFLCIFVGVLSGVGGGVLRDMFSAVVPFVLQKRIYAVACIVAAVMYYYLCIAGMEQFGALIAIIFTVVIRYLAARFRWRLPRADSFGRKAE